MTFRAGVLLSHRWTALASSLVLAMLGITGAILLLESESFLARAASRLHETLGLAGPGRWIVALATVAAVFLEVSGVVLWWKRRSVKVRTSSGWRSTLNDVHHSAGVIGLVLMLTLAVTGVGMAFSTPANYPVFRKTMVNFHTAHDFPIAVKGLYFAATLGFVIQAATGIVMWWRPRRRRASPVS